MREGDWVDYLPPRTDGDKTWDARFHMFKTAQALMETVCNYRAVIPGMRFFVCVVIYLEERGSL